MRKMVRYSDSNLNRSCSKRFSFFQTFIYVQNLINMLIWREKDVARNILVVGDTQNSWNKKPHDVLANLSNVQLSMRVIDVKIVSKKILN